MTGMQHSLRDLERQALAELAMRRSVQRNPADRAHVVATRIAVVASTIAGLIAVWDLQLLVLR
jgi:hypothetical protein